MSKKTATEVAGSVNLEGVFVCTGEPYEVIKVLGKCHTDSKGYRRLEISAKGHSRHNKLQKKVFILGKKLSFEYVSLRGKT